MLATKIKFFKIVLFYLHVSMSLLKVTPKLGETVSMQPPGYSYKFVLDESVRVGVK